MLRRNGDANSTNVLIIEGSKKAYLGPDSNAVQLDRAVRRAEYFRMMYEEQLDIIEMLESLETAEGPVLLRTGELAS
jgi:hypothetical protein